MQNWQPNICLLHFKYNGVVGIPVCISTGISLVYMYQHLLYFHNFKRQWLFNVVQPNRGKMFQVLLGHSLKTCHTKLYVKYE